MSLLAGILMLVMGGMSAQMTQEYVLTSDKQQQEYLDDLAKNAQEWYQRVSPQIELSGEAITEAQLLSQIAPTQKYGVRAAISGRYTKIVPPWTQPALGYRTILIWIPQEGGDTTSLSSTSESPTIDPLVLTTKKFRTWSTFGYQHEQLAKVSDLLVRTGLVLQNWARAQQGNRAGQTFDNFFRAADCSVTLIDHLPCVDTYTDINATQIPAYLGIAPTELMSQWGYAVEISNLLDSSTSTPPYSLALRIHSPISPTDYLISRIELPQ